MAITFGSNTTTNGTPGNDTMIGVDPTGNKNDIVYGHQGDDSISAVAGFTSSTIYGGQGNDIITDENFTTSGAIGGNVMYGNFGDDTISIGDTAIGDTVYGGQGNDVIRATDTAFNVVYGNLGDDSIVSDDSFSNTLYGGQGNDAVNVFADNHDVIYGNFGNDFLYASAFTDNSHMYGGQGDDTLVFTGFFGGGNVNDVETGNLGNDLFVATGNNSFGFLENANDIVTVTDFLQGTDLLSESDDAIGGFVGGLQKIAAPGANAQQALNDANLAYALNSTERYVFVYGGTGAGYLFLNQTEFGGQTVQSISGLKIDGSNGEFSVNASDITTFSKTISA